MSVSTPIAEYQDQAPDWRLMSDSLAGERRIKAATTRYLPKTSGMLAAESYARAEDSPINPTQAAQIYRSYVERAQYPAWVSDSLRTMNGLVSRLTPTVDLPRQLQNVGTQDGFGLEQLFQRVVGDLLKAGRVALLADFDEDGRPFIAQYAAESVIRWREQAGQLTQVVMVETRSAAEDEFDDSVETVYRVLDLQDGAYRVRLFDADGVVISEDYPGTTAGTLDFIPLTFAGGCDNNTAVDPIPLLSMARHALQYYRLSGDYFQSLHHCAHPQPVVTGLDEDTDLRVSGPMAAWTLPEGASAFYLETSGTGIEATRQAMLDQRDAALEAGARVLDRGRSAESGDARRARQDDQQATLHNVCHQAAEAIEQVLGYLAVWAGATQLPLFAVEPKFSSEVIDSALVQIVSNMTLAGELPRSVLYNALRKTGVTSLSDEELEEQREGSVVDA